MYRVPRPSLALILMLLLASQLVATDVYLPALPQIASEFGGRAGPVQWTLTAFILAFGLAQLGVGWRADQIGRRPLLLWGLGLYVVAATLGALASGLAILIASRVVLGIGTAMCIVGARAVIRDRYEGAAGMGVMARSMSGMGAIGVLSPLAGGIVTQTMGWHWTLALVAGFGTLAWLAVYCGLEESCTAHASTASNSSTAALGYFAILRHRQFLACSLLAGTSFSGAMCFLLLSPFVFIRDLGLSRLAYGAVPASCTLAFLAGTVLCRHALQRHAVPR
ncbi:MAG: MFS transporter, partial [Sphingomonadaceae bacterium]